MLLFFIEIIGILSLLSIILLIPLYIVLIISAGIYDFVKKRFNSLKYVLLSVLITYGILFSILFLSLYINRQPSPQDLKKHYFQNKTELNILAEKIQTDQKKGLERVDETWTRPSDVNTIGLTQKDINDYRNELNKLKIPRGFYAFPDRIDFILHTSGLSISGTSTGYVYAEVEPQNYFKENCGYSLQPFNDLSDYKGCDGYTKSYKIYQKIDDNWYIFQDLED